MVRTTFTTTGIAAALCCALVPLSGCQGDSGTPAASSVPGSTAPATSTSGSPLPSSSPSRESSASTSPSSNGDGASAEAASAVKRYYEVTGAVAADPASDMNKLQTVARGAALESRQFEISQFRSKGFRFTGELVPTLERATPGGDAREWKLTYCVDASATDLVDAKGKSVRGNGPKKVRSQLVLTQDPKTFDWFVTQDKAIEPC